MLLSNFLKHLFRVPNNEPKADLGVVMAKSNKNRRYKMRSTGRTGSKMQNAREPTGLIQFVQNLFQFAENPLEPFSQANRRGCQCDSMRRSDKKRRVQIRFQPPDLRGNSRLREMQPSGRFGNLACIGDHEEGMQPTGV